MMIRTHVLEKSPKRTGFHRVFDDDEDGPSWSGSHVVNRPGEMKRFVGRDDRKRNHFVRSFKHCTIVCPVILLSCVYDGKSQKSSLKPIMAGANVQIPRHISRGFLGEVTSQVYCLPPQKQRRFSCIFFFFFHSKRIYAICDRTLQLRTYIGTYTYSIMEKRNSEQYTREYYDNIIYLCYTQRIRNKIYVQRAHI